MKILFLFSVTLLLVGCGTISEQSIYEGLRSQQKQKNEDSLPKGKSLPTYDNYIKERENSLKK